MLALFFQYLTGAIFLSPRNISLLLRQTAIIGVATAGIVVVMVSGEIDLSVGSAVYLISAIVAPLLVNGDIGTGSAIVLAIFCGVALGLWQGFWVAFQGVPSFVVTLVGLLIFRGIGFLITNAQAVAPMPDTFVQLSEGFIPRSLSAVLIAVGTIVWLGSTLRKALREHGATGSAWVRIAPQVTLGALGLAVFSWAVLGYRGIPAAVGIMILVIIAFTYVTQSTKIGRYFYAIGGNREAAQFAGISVRGTVLLAFALIGFVYGVAGLLLTARLNGSTPEGGTYMELDAIAAAVIGGTSLSGGVGSVPRAMLGALLLAVLDNGMSLMNVTSFVQMVVKGLVLLLAVWIDIQTRQRQVN